MGAGPLPPPNLGRPLGLRPAPSTAATAAIDRLAFASVEPGSCARSLGLGLPALVAALAESPDPWGDGVTL